MDNQYRNKNMTAKKITRNVCSVCRRKMLNWKVLLIAVLLLVCLSTYIKPTTQPKTNDYVRWRPATFDTGVRKIVVATLYRSGSSFIGEVLKHIPDSFYAFEPLMYLHLNEYNLNMHNDTVLTPKLAYYLNHIVNCNYELIVNDSLKLFPGNNWHRNWWTNITGFPGHNSIESAQASCLKKQYRINKIIRAYYIKDIASIMTHNVTIIHLVRDPRGSIYSAVKAWAGNMSDVKIRSNLNVIKRDVGYLCKTLRTNLHFIHNDLGRLYKNYKDNYIFIRYEDFAFSPQRMLRKLYRHLGVKVQAKTLEWVKKITSFKSGDSYATTRDSRAAANQWRISVPLVFVEMIQNECQDVIEGYGYNMLTGEHMLRNLSFPFVSKVPLKAFEHVKVLDMF